MNRLILENGNIFNGYGFIGYKDILIEDGKVIAIDAQINLDCQRIDMEGKYVCPGFIDIHIHGALGWDFTDAGVDDIKKICFFLAKHGITSILATALTAGNEKINSCLQQIKALKSEKYTGANVLGVHLEGPFINIKRKGGLNEQYIQMPSIDSYNILASGYEDIIKTITLAPEIPGAKELIKYLRDKGIYVSIGHSTATYEETIEAIHCGANRATHIFNGMDALNHREPGTVGGLLDSKDVFVEMIVDLIHLHPAVIRLLLNAKGADRCIAITDAIEAAGLEDGEYNIGGKMVIVKGFVGRLKDTLALSGSTITLDQSLKNMIAIGINLEDALKTVTSNPARAIGVNDRKGEVKQGFDADITVLDKSFDVAMVLINGEVIKQ